MLGGTGASALRTNLIVHHGVANILRQVSKRIHIIGAIQEPRDLASLFKWDEVLENIIQFTNKSHTSD